MMGQRYDVIVVGGGPSGLFSAGLLAHVGKKVLVLEKEDMVGGRAGSITYRGHILHNGPHGQGNTGWVEQIFDKLGKPAPEKGMAYVGTEIYDYERGRWLPFRQMFSFKEARSILEREVVGASEEDLKKYDDLSLEEWVAQRSSDEGTRMFFWSLATSFCHGNLLEPISAGEFLITIRQMLDTWGGLRRVAGAFVGGYASVIEPVVKSIREDGGEIRTGARVSNIVVENGCAKGVEVEAGPRLLPTHIVDVEYLEAPVVICTVPMWDMFKVISEKCFPTWYVDWVHSIQRKVTVNAGFVAAFDRPLWDEEISRLVPRMRRAGLIGSFQLMPEYAGNTGETQGVFALQGNYDEMPNLFEGSRCDVRLQMRKLLDDFEEDVREVMPEFEASCKWKVRYAGYYSLAMTPGMVGDRRIPIEPPGVRNLYLASDTLREARGVGGGIEYCARAALRCSERVTEDMA